MSGDAAKTAELLYRFAQGAQCLQRDRERALARCRNAQQVDDLVKKLFSGRLTLVDIADVAERARDIGGVEAQLRAYQRSAENLRQAGNDWIWITFLGCRSRPGVTPLAHGVAQQVELIGEHCQRVRQTFTWDRQAVLKQTRAACLPASEQVAIIRDMFDHGVVHLAGGAAGFCVCFVEDRSQFSTLHRLGWAARFSRWAEEEIAKQLDNLATTIHFTSHGAEAVGKAAGAAIGTVILPLLGTGDVAQFGCIGGVLFNGQKLYLEASHGRLAKLDSNGHPIYLAFLADEEGYYPHSSFSDVNYESLRQQVFQRGNLQNFQSFVASPLCRKMVAGTWDVYSNIKKAANDYLTREDPIRYANAAVATLSTLAASVSLAYGGGLFAVNLQYASIDAGAALALEQMGWDGTSAAQIMLDINHVCSLTRIWDMMLNAALVEAKELAREGRPVEWMADCQLLHSDSLHSIVPDYIDDNKMVMLQTLYSAYTVSTLSNRTENAYNYANNATFWSAIATLPGLLWHLVKIKREVGKNIVDGGRFGVSKQKMSEGANKLDKPLDALCVLLHMIKSVNPDAFLSEVKGVMPRMIRMHLLECTLPPPAPRWGDWLGSWVADDDMNVYFVFEFNPGPSGRIRLFSTERDIISSGQGRQIKRGASINCNKVVLTRFYNEKVTIRAFDQRNLVTSTLQGNPELGALSFGPDHIVKNADGLLEWREAMPLKLKYRIFSSDAPAMAMPEHKRPRLSTGRPS